MSEKLVTPGARMVVWKVIPEVQDNAQPVPQIALPSGLTGEHSSWAAVI